jgi:hypothetical protein
MSYTEATLPLMLHLVADDGAGMLFAAGSISALFELGALSKLEVWSCSGLGCVVMSILLTVCEGLFDHADVTYQLDTTDPIHRMAVEHFMTLVQSAVKEMPDTHGSHVSIGQRMCKSSTMELLVVLLCSITLGTLSYLHSATTNTTKCLIVASLLSLLLTAWSRTYLHWGQFGRLLTQYICDSPMSHSDASVVLIPTTPTLSTNDCTHSTQEKEQEQQQHTECPLHTQAPLIILTNAHVMPTMDRRTTQYKKLTSLRDAVYTATTQPCRSAMALDQLLLGPLNAYYTYNRMPLRCTQGRTLLVVDGWSLSPSYCSSTTMLSAHKRMEDDISTLTGAPDHNSESVRLYTGRPIAIIDTAYTIDDIQGDNLRDFYSTLHTVTAKGPISDQLMVQDLLNWGYLATCVVAGKQLLSAHDMDWRNSGDAVIRTTAVNVLHSNHADMDERKSISTDLGDTRHRATAIDTQATQLHCKLRRIVDLRPFQSSTHFNIKQFLRLFCYCSYRSRIHRCTLSDGDIYVICQTILHITYNNCLLYSPQVQMYPYNEQTLNLYNRNY